MAKSFVFSLCLFLIFNGCLAARQQSQHGQQNECQLNQLQAREPDNRIQAEAGQIETWDYNREDFQCAGVAAARITIEQNGLHLPSYSNAPQLIYIVQGRGVLGTVFSGCPETFEESQQQQGQQQFQHRGRGQRQQQEEQEQQQRQPHGGRGQRQQQEEQEQQQRQPHGGRGQRQQQEEQEQQRQQEQQRRQQEQQRRQQGQGQQGQQEQEWGQQRHQQGPHQQQRGQQGQQFEQLDRHQKIRQIREGDVIAIPAGVAYWSYNDGNKELVAVSLLDVSNDNNQLDQTPRRFYLAGNPENEFEQQGQQSQHRQQQQRQQRGQRGQQEEEEQFGQRGQQGSRGQRQQEEEWGQQHGRQQQQRGRGQHQQQQGNGSNVFSGFSTQLLAQALNVDEETAQNLQGQNDNRNQIIRVKGQLDFVQPPQGRQERQHEQREQEQIEQERQQARQQGGQQLANGFEETFCTMRLKENIGNPQRADIYSPQAGRISTLNSHTLPILRNLRLSAERGFFYNNGIYSPHWNVNAHSVVYVIRGNARVQVVNHQGEPILDQEVQEGQLFIVPQNHGVIQQAGNEGFEYIAFKTEDNAVINTMAGRTSFLRALPVEVLSNAYQISREQARMVKYNRQETVALSSSQQSQFRAIA